MKTFPFSKIVLAFLLLLVPFHACKKKSLDIAFHPMISAFTSGTISNQSNIIIRLSQDIEKAVEINVPVEKKLFKFSPSIEGQAMFIDQRTIVFKPSKALPSGTDYTAVFNLGAITDTKGNAKKFEFSFSTISQAMRYKIDGFKVYKKSEPNLYKYTGIVRTADYAEAQLFENVLTVAPSNYNKSVKWVHTEDGRTHTFIIDSIERKENSYEIKLSFSGKSFDSDFEDEFVDNVPALGEFSLIRTKIIHYPEQYIICQFSDPVSSKQMLNGLIQLSTTQVSHNVDLNEVYIYPPLRQKGESFLSIEAGLKTEQGIEFKTRYQETIQFEDLKPAVEIIGNGTILPNSNGWVFPFKAVNLRAVEVRIVKIYENNVLQFLQTNDLAGNSEIKRAGKLIAKKTILLGVESPIELTEWNTYSIDLSKLIKSEPGAIYRVELTFKKRHSVIACNNNKIEQLDPLEVKQQDETDLKNEQNDYDSYYSYYSYYEDSYYDGDYYGGDYDDPCSDSYYSGKSVARNVLASDLGIIAKMGSNRVVTVAISNLVTAKPMSGVEIDIYDFQQQIIGSGKTDQEGLVAITVNGKPFALVAKNDSERGYLKMDDGSSLSLSNFDVSGSQIEKGLKGFIYGERGVWRPGDTLYLSFILEDENNILPPNHPVIIDLYNPMGQIAGKKVLNAGVNGFYCFNFNTAEDAPTGNWGIYARVGGASFYKALRIETVKPNRLKIDLSFEDEFLIAAKKINAKLSVKWLHGANAKNLSADIKGKFSMISTSFPNYQSFIFDDPGKSFYNEESTIYDGNVDENGEANIEKELSFSNAPGTLSAKFIVRAFEEGGDFSTMSFTKKMYAFDSYIGIKAPEGQGYWNMLVTDKANRFEVVSVNAKGDPISKNNLEVLVYKVDWSWWWSSSNNSLANYANNAYNTPVFSKTISTRNGKGNFDFTINYPEYGRYYVRIVDKENNNSTGTTVYIDWPDFSGRSQRNTQEGANMLTFNTDKKSYKPGDKAEIVFPSSVGARALISIESGSKVIHAFWAEGGDKETKTLFEVTSEMVPNVFVHISLVQPHAQTLNDAPLRMYGVIPLIVEDPETILKPEIKMPDELAPEKEFSVEISEKNKKDMTYTLAIVDEGLLDLTGFQTPNPYETFFAREALGVKTWDIYNQVIGAFGGKIEQLFSIGGGAMEMMKEEDEKTAGRFKPVVKFLGPFTLNGGSSNKHNITLPQYIGSVRVMVVAGNKNAYGSAEKAVPVRNPLMVLATLPRVVGPGETVVLPVTVFAMDKNIKNVNVKVEANDYFQLTGGVSQSVSFDKTGDKTIYFTCKIKEKIGVGKVKVIAISCKEKAENDIEISVRNPNPRMSKFTESIIEAGKTWNTTYNLIGMMGTNTLTLEISSLPPIDLSNRLTYLIQYPHGCIEQTTSSGFPQLYLDDISELNKDMKARTEENIKATLIRLKSFLTSEGGFAYWPGENTTSDWGTNYAGHFMIEAENKGYTLPYGLKDSWLKFQKRIAKQWTRENRSRRYVYDQSDLTQAYRLYTLALAGDPELGSMNRMKEMKDLSQEAKWRLAAAYAVVKQDAAAAALVAGLTISANPYTGFSESYGSVERDEALILETLTILKEKTKAFELAKKISESLGKDQWMSTQTTAYCLLAVSSYIKTSGASSKLQYEHNLNAKNNLKESVSKTISQVSFGEPNKTSGSLSVKNTGGGPLYARLINSGIPIGGNEEAAESQLKISVSFINNKGNAIDVSRLEQGTDFKAIVSISHPGGFGTYNDMVLQQIFASGWEITNLRLLDENDKESQSYSYQDIRDDRVYTYFDIYERSTKTFTVHLTAAYQGSFYLPAFNAETMYSNLINARNKGQWVEVFKQVK